GDWGPINKFCNENPYKKTNKRFGSFRIRIQLTVLLHIKIGCYRIHERESDKPEKKGEMLHKMG
ncbi:hypothetical protein QU844_25670, partial [Escherichia coli]|nr:hypothetical protein [Escherichia coli]